MIRIAIVEDDKVSAGQLQEYIRRYELESSESIQITVFEDGEDIVTNYRPVYDIILMDIEMRFMDGMSASEEIRKLDEKVIIIFITNMAQYAIRGYSVGALDYVLKPISYFAFSQRLDRAVERLKKNEKRYLIIRVKGGSRRIATEDIYYIESQGHVLIVHEKDGEEITSGTMTEMEEKLAELHFCRCNKGYLVNLEHVESIRDGCAVVGGDFLTISRPRKKIFQETLAAYMNEVML
ncbi:MAG: LytTR family DNA-binding domain-containing protein [Eubacteriales bacterium]|nr:LytTR family DNA-binding domain-containing protein [Eubacteriales bacterium]